MNQADVGREYDSWLAGGSLSAIGYSFLASVPGALLVNTPVFRLHEKLALRPGQRLLDIGCGRASLLRIVSERVHFETPPVGIDLSREMLRKADRTGLSLAQAAATALPFAAAAFDVAICSYVVKHLADEELLRFLEELHRVLTPGGLALVWEFAPTRSALLNTWNMRLITRGVSSAKMRSQTTLAAYAVHAGFGVVETARLRPFLYPPIPRVSLVFQKNPEPGPPTASGEPASWRSRTGLGRAQLAGGDTY